MHLQECQPRVIIQFFIHEQVRFRFKEKNLIVYSHKYVMQLAILRRLYLFWFFIHPMLIDPF